MECMVTAVMPQDHCVDDSKVWDCIWIALLMAKEAMQNVSVLLTS
jgi:hypothetical protein